MPYDFLKDKKILVTGGAGFLGSKVVANLLQNGIAGENIFVPRFEEYDLRESSFCKKAVQGRDVVIHVAGRVGGIGFSRTHPADAYYDNTAMALHMIDASYRAGVQKFVGIGSICSYPKFTPVPFREEDLWNGYPEETAAAYGLAKKNMLVQSQAYRAQYGFNAVHLLIVNMYGPGDSTDPEHSHVIPALIQKVIKARKDGSPFIEVWGTGLATREFLYVEDAAEGIVRAAELYNGNDPVNLGSGNEISIKELVNEICGILEYKVDIKWDASRPDGQPKRRLDVSRAEKLFGFRAGTSFHEGLKKTIEWYSAKFS